MGKITHNLSIKCVQPVNTLWKRMCTTLAYTQRLVSMLVQLCTKSIQSPVSQQLVHRHFKANYHRKHPSLYTVSTEPITTTIELLHKRQETI